MPAVTFENVTKRFGKVVALENVSFDIEDGEYVCALGPTGSGKTTLLRLMAGLLTPDEGTIYFDKKPVNKVDAQERNAVYVPQQYALFPHLTVLENVAFGPLAREKTDREALEMASKTLELVRLGWRSQSFPNELSGGMQQRVALARGLASGAGLLLLDEPLGALDARLRLDLRHKIRSIVKDSGFTAIHVTHDRDEAMSVGDRIMILRRGRLQDYGSPTRVYTKPASIFVANLIGGASFLEGVVERETEDRSVLRLRGGITVTTPPIALNEPAVIAVRRERLQISREPFTVDNLLKGQVRDVRFLGNSYEYLVRIANGDVLNCRKFSDDPQPSFRKGEDVMVGFRESDVLTFGYPINGLRKELEVA